MVAYQLVAWGNCPEFGHAGPGEDVIIARVGIRDRGLLRDWHAVFPGAKNGT